MKNTVYAEKKYLIQLISFSQKRYFILYNENKIVLCFKKGCFIGPQKRRFRLKKGCFSRPESEQRGYFSSLGTSVVSQGRYDASYHREIDCLLKLTRKETSNRAAVVCDGNQPVIHGFHHKGPVMVNAFPYYDFTINTLTLNTFGNPKTKATTQTINTNTSLRIFLRRDTLILSSIDVTTTSTLANWKIRLSIVTVTTLMSLFFKQTSDNQGGIPI